MKKLLTILVCIVLFLPVVQTAYAAEIPSFSSEEAVMEHFNELSKSQAGAIAAHDVFYKTFLSGEPDTYPENYGGTYIEDNLLHINIVDLEQQDLTPYKAVLADHLNVVRFMDVDYSIRTLDQARDFIWEEFRSLGIHVVSAGIGNANNAVSLGVTPETIHKLPSFITLGEKSMHPTLQVPVLVTVEGIPVALSANDAPAPVPGQLPAFLPLVGCAVFVLAMAGFLFLRRKG